MKKMSIFAVAIFTLFGYPMFANETKEPQSDPITTTEPVGTEEDEEETAVSFNDDEEGEKDGLI